VDYPLLLNATAMAARSATRWSSPRAHRIADEEGGSK
jgi:hypothetical protein